MPRTHEIHLFFFFLELIKQLDVISAKYLFTFADTSQRFRWHVQIEKDKDFKKGL